MLIGVQWARRSTGPLVLQDLLIRFRMSQDLADHRQALTKRQGPAGEGVAQVMDPHARQAGPLANALPRVLNTDKMGAPLPAGNDPWIAPFAREGGQEPHCCRRQRYGAAAGFRIRQFQFACAQVDMRPAQGQYFRQSAARQHQQPDRRQPRGFRASFLLAQTWNCIGAAKEAGDDPDATNAGWCAPGAGVQFRAGPGVGTATLPGLPLRSRHVDDCDPLGGNPLFKLAVG